MTAEEFMENHKKLALTLQEQEVRGIMAMTGCDRERAKQLLVWLQDDELVIGGLHRVQGAGHGVGEKLARHFRQAARRLAKAGEQLSDEVAAAIEAIASLGRRS